MGVIKISDELDEKLEELAKKTNRSKKDIVEEAVRLYVLGSSDDKQIKSLHGKVIQLQFPTKCSKCKKELKEGDLAYWSKVVYTDNTSRSYVTCLDCYYSESGLSEMYLKKKKLEVIIKGLEKKANDLVKKVELMEAEVSLASLKAEVSNLFRSFVQTLGSSNSADVHKIDEFLTSIRSVVDRIEVIEFSIKSLKPKVVKKVVKDVKKEV